MKRYYLVIVVLLSACSSTGVIPMDKDSYMVSKRSAQVGFGPAIGAKADLYEEANAFCAKQNKAVETVNIETTDSGFARPASASLQFRCIAKQPSSYRVNLTGNSRVLKRWAPPRPTSYFHVGLGSSADYSKHWEK